MQGTDPALAIERATQALYATASTQRQPRLVKTIMVMMVIALVLVAMAPILASSMRPDGDASPVAGAHSADVSHSSTALSAAQPSYAP